MFVASKVLGFFALPTNLVICIGLFGLLLLVTRFARAGRRLMAASLILTAIIGWSPIGNALILPLEERFPAWDARRGAPDGIVVLGGALDTLVSATRPEAALNEAAERMSAAVDLARRYPSARIIFSGGSGALVFQGDLEADVARRFFDSMGLAPGRVLSEDKSRDTNENAVFSRQVANPKPSERWLLVTSAYHMPRSIGAFRRAGFAVEAYPCDWRTRGASDLTRPFTSVGDGFRRTDTAMREWVGLIMYRLTGRSSEFFPGP